MKYVRFLLIAVAPAMFLSMVSCDKVTDLTAKAKGLFSDDEDSDSAKSVAVEKVDEKAGKEIIACEARLAMVEFYSDT